MNQMRLVHGSLFSGFDAPSVAASWMGWENAFHCEINHFCNEILKYWFPNSEHYEDITKTDFRQWEGRIDVLTGGFPCQPFSVAGKRKGADDNRYLWPHMLRAIREIRPTWVIGENVAGILTMVQPGEEVEVGNQTSIFGEDDRKRVLLRQEYVVETICKDLEREGYSVQPMLIPACAVGAPHRRDRVWIIANRTDAGTESMQQTGEDSIHSIGDVADTDSHRWRVGKDQQVTIAECKGTADIGTFSKDGASCYSNGKRLQGCFNNRKHPKEREKSYDQQSCRLLCEDWEDFPAQSPVCRRNDGLPFNVHDLTISFTKWRQESIKGYGNAIVPQVILEIFKAIEEVEKLA